MAAHDRARRSAVLRAVLLASVWFATALAATAPGLLLLGNADSRHPQVAGVALVLASVAAVGVGVACAIGRPGPSLRTSAVVVLLCLVAQVSLGLDDVVYGSGLVFGGAAGLLAGLAGALSFGAGRGRDQVEQPGQDARPGRRRRSGPGDVRVPR